MSNLMQQRPSILLASETLTLSSLIFSTLVRKRSSRLVQASLWLSDVKAKKYATASPHTLEQNTDTKSNIRRQINVTVWILGKREVNYNRSQLFCSELYYVKKVFDLSCKMQNYRDDDCVCRAN